MRKTKETSSQDIQDFQRAIAALKKITTTPKKSKTKASTADIQVPSTITNPKLIHFYRYLKNLQTEINDLFNQTNKSYQDFILSLSPDDKQILSQLETYFSPDRTFEVPQKIIECGPEFETIDEANMIREAERHRLISLVHCMKLYSTIKKRIINLLKEHAHIGTKERPFTIADLGAGANLIAPLYYFLFNHDKEILAYRKHEPIPYIIIAIDLPTRLNIAKKEHPEQHHYYIETDATNLANLKKAIENSGAPINHGADLVTMLHPNIAEDVKYRDDFYFMSTKTAPYLANPSQTPNFVTCFYHQEEFDQYCFDMKRLGHTISDKDISTHHGIFPCIQLRKENKPTLSPACFQITMTLPGFGLNLQQDEVQTLQEECSTTEKAIKAIVKSRNTQATRFYKLENYKAALPLFQANTNVAKWLPSKLRRIAETNLAKTLENLNDRTLGKPKDRTLGKPKDSVLVAQPICMATNTATLIPNQLTCETNKPPTDKHSCCKRAFSTKLIVA